jgi:ATP-dependent Clp protease ATP-binding subunit ClpA
MTSNAGSDRAGGALGFGKTKNEASRERSLKALEKFLRPEFIGRVDEVVVFNDLTEAEYKKIAALLLDELVDPLRDKGIELTYDDAATSTIAALSADGTRGARDIRSCIRKNVEDSITAEMVSRIENPVRSVFVTAEDGKVICKYE